MKKSNVLTLFALAFFIAVSFNHGKAQTKGNSEKTVDLLKPAATGILLDDAIKKRRTIRDFDEKKKMNMQELSNILYAMQGMTEGKKRTVASARGTYPLGVYIIANRIQGLDDGIYRMDISAYRLVLLKKGDFGDEISAACMSQPWPKKAQAKIIITCVWKRLGGETGKSFSLFEAGEAAQNGYLMAAALGLHTVPVGGINPGAVAKVIGIDNNAESPVIVNCIGR